MILKKTINPIEEVGKDWKKKKAKQLLKDEDCLHCYYGEKGSFFPIGERRVCSLYEPGNICNHFAKREYKEIYE